MFSQRTLVAPLHVPRSRLLPLATSWSGSDTRHLQRQRTSTPADCRVYRVPCRSEVALRNEEIKIPHPQSLRRSQQRACAASGVSFQSAPLLFGPPCLLLGPPTCFVQPASQVVPFPQALPCTDEPPTMNERHVESRVTDWRLFEKNRAGCSNVVVVVRVRIATSEDMHRRQQRSTTRPRRTASLSSQPFFSSARASQVACV